MAFKYQQISQDFIKEFFNHTNGLLSRKDNGFQGTKNMYGYIVFGIGKNRYPAHKLVWLYHNNTLPVIGYEIDHINQDRSDNRIENLRIVTRQENKFNTNAKGYSLIKKTGKFRARIRVDGKYYSLGCYSTEIEAKDAYQKAKLQYHKIGA